MYISCINSLLRLEVDVADLYHWADEALKGRCAHTSIGRTGDHPLSHSNPDYFSGEDLWTQGTASLARWGNYFWSQGVEKSNKRFLSPAHYQGIRHSSTTTTFIAKQEGWPKYKTLYTACLKRGRESCARSCVLKTVISKKVVYKPNSWECYRYLYPTYKPTPSFKLWI